MEYERDTSHSFHSGYVLVSLSVFYLRIMFHLSKERNAHTFTAPNEKNKVGRHNVLK